MTKTVLVTGGAGYIGSHACKALAAEYHLHGPGMMPATSALHMVLAKHGRQREQVH